MKRILVDKSPQKELDRIDAVMRRRIINGIAGILQEPPQGDIKPLKGPLHGLYRLRVGDWRITYEITEDSIRILNILPRGEAYKKGV